MRVMQDNIKEVEGKIEKLEEEIPKKQEEIQMLKKIREDLKRIQKTLSEENRTLMDKLWEKAGYRERQKLVFGTSKKIVNVQDGIYRFCGICFACKLAGYKDFTIFE
jgi:SMC interacting uncharacterized protein involved in chromosome segregation